MKKRFVGILMAVVAIIFSMITLAEAETIPLKLGDTTVKVNIYKKGGGPTYVALHDNENTAVAAAKSVIAARGGRLVELSHGGGRNITFKLKGKKYTFDPNRMFTNPGIKATLSRQGGYSKEAHIVVYAFSQSVLKLIRSGGGPLIALHNNSNGGNLSVLSYKKGGQYAREASMVFVNPDMDPDDFFLVTSSSVANKLKAKGYNVVLQSRNPTNDGSLSVAWSGSYINAEAQDGHGAVQKKMLLQLLSPAGM